MADVTEDGEDIRYWESLAKYHCGEAGVSKDDAAKAWHEKMYKLAIAALGAHVAYVHAWRVHGRPKTWPFYFGPE